MKKQTSKRVKVTNASGAEVSLTIDRGDIHLIDHNGNMGSDYITIKEVRQIAKTAVKIKDLAASADRSYKAYFQAECDQTVKWKAVRQLKAQLERAESELNVLTDSRNLLLGRYEQDRKPLYAHDFMTAGGYDVMFHPDCIAIGCKKFTYDAAPSVAAKLIKAAARKAAK